jgi:prepilin-type N-terminal cleavage/methylation domain-containing protein
MRLSASSSARGGYTLIELMVVLSLLGTFAVTASSVFVQSVVLSRDAQRGQKAVGQIQFALRQLRADVWGATAIVVPIAGSFLLRQGDGAVITWTTYAQDDGAADDESVILIRALEQANPTTRQREFTLPMPMQVTANRVGLVVRLDEDEALMVSQVLLAKESR